MMSIRQTGDGKASVLDLIRNATTGRGERRIWVDLKAKNPELLALTDVVRFPDDAGRPEVEELADRVAICDATGGGLTPHPKSLVLQWI
jgi:hypothetical protein